MVFNLNLEGVPLKVGFNLTLINKVFCGSRLFLLLQVDEKHWQRIGEKPGDVCPLRICILWRRVRFLIKSSSSVFNLHVSRRAEGQK